MAKLLFLTFCVVLAAVVFDSAQAAATCACTNSGTTCTTYSAYVTCLKAVTVANTCSTSEVSTADGQRSAAELTMKTLGCSGAGSLMTSAGLVLVLTSLAYLFNGKKI